MSRPRVTAAHIETAQWMSRMSDAARVGALGEDGYRLAYTFDSILAGQQIARALGFTAPGNCEPLLAIAHRDELLRRLAREFYGKELPTVAAREISARLLRYEASGAWKTDRALSAPSAAMQRTERELQWRILKVGLGAPSSKTIIRAMDRNPRVIVRDARLASPGDAGGARGQDQNDRMAESRCRRR